MSADCSSHADPASDPSVCNHCEGLCGQVAADTVSLRCIGHDGAAGWTASDPSHLRTDARAGPLRPPRASRLS